MTDATSAICSKGMHAARRLPAAAAIPLLVLLVASSCQRPADSSSARKEAASLAVVETRLPSGKTQRYRMDVNATPAQLKKSVRRIVKQTIEQGLETPRDSAEEVAFFSLSCAPLESEPQTIQLDDGKQNAELKTSFSMSHLEYRVLLRPSSGIEAKLCVVTEFRVGAADEWRETSASGIWDKEQPIDHIDIAVPQIADDMVEMIDAWNQLAKRKGELFSPQQ